MTHEQALKNRILPQSRDNILVVEIGDRITLEDYNAIFSNAAANLLTKYPEGRLLLKYTRPFHGWDMDAAEQDFGILASKGSKISKIALVDPPESVLPKWEAFKVVIGELRIFERSQFDEALAWIEK